ncbi:hypothetical protein P3102_35230 [Amycolatopsis sp. QT-25]|nr:hypothetical protein [Amycolatopsis sp. QT-25]WET79223.1 hypothetical protein P3102_35230 [Amycolatopsis sp. QT-25]
MADRAEQAKANLKKALEEENLEKIIVAANLKKWAEEAEAEKKKAAEKD